MISASSRARVLNGETTTWATRLKNSIIHTSLAPLAAHASADRVFSKDRSAHRRGLRACPPRADGPFETTKRVALSLVCLLSSARMAPPLAGAFCGRLRRKDDTGSCEGVTEP